MAKFLVVIISYVIGSVILRFLSAVGIGFYTYSFLGDAIDTAMGYLDQYISAMPVAIIQLLTLGGFIEGLSLIGSAMLVSAAFTAARVFIGSVS